MILEQKVHFLDLDCDVEVNRYANNRIALVLRHESEMSPIAVATLNIPEEELKVDEVCIKDYSENKGMYQSLLSAGIIKGVNRVIRQGFVKIPICSLTNDVLNQIQQNA